MVSLLVASSDSALRSQIRRLLGTGSRLTGASIMEAGSVAEIAAALASGTHDVAIIEEPLTTPSPAVPSRTLSVVLSTTARDSVLRLDGRTVLRHPVALNRLVEEVERLLPRTGPALDPAAELEASFRALQADYLGTLPERIVALRTAVASGKTGDKAGLEEARRIFHQVRGTGASFGMPELTDAAARGETALIELARDPAAQVWGVVDDATNAMEVLAANGVTEPL